MYLESLFYLSEVEISRIMIWNDCHFIITLDDADTGKIVIFVPYEDTCVSGRSHHTWYVDMMVELSRVHVQRTFRYTFRWPDDPGDDARGLLHF